GEPGEQPRPSRDELCPASLSQFAKYIKKTVKGEKREAWIWDGLDGRWVRQDQDRPKPGSVVLLRASAGGYDDALGFDADSVAAVPDRRPDNGEQTPSLPGDEETLVGRFITLAEHTQNVVGRAARLAEDLGFTAVEADLLERAAWWHDMGKAHPAFQTALADYEATHENSGDAEDGKERPIWAKSSGEGRLRYRIESNNERQERRYFRHELASMLAWLAHGTVPSSGVASDREGEKSTHQARDLIAYMIAAHHGKLRMALRALPGEAPPPEGQRFARGIWEGDELPTVGLEGANLPATRLSLELMELGRGSQGPS